MIYQRIVYIKWHNSNYLQYPNKITKQGKPTSKSMHYVYWTCHGGLELVWENIPLSGIYDATFGNDYKRAFVVRRNVHIIYYRLDC